MRSQLESLLLQASEGHLDTSTRSDAICPEAAVALRFLKQRDLALAVSA